MPDALEIVGDPPATVDVRVRGSSAQLSRIDPGEVVAMLDLSSARTGSRLFHLRTDEVRVPVRHRSRAGDAADAVARAREVRAADGADRSGDRRRSRARLRGRADAAEPSTVEIVGPESRVRAGLGSDDRAVSRSTASSDRVRDVVTVGVADSSVRLTRAAERDGRGRDRAGTGRARGGRCAGALAQSGHGAGGAAYHARSDDGHHPRAARDALAA